ncbi:uncharacterized protein TRUGW13939_06686 [Talaromyces rugulosus]|uniref:NADP-dependent oxidoreductase domain-containing protein n=1 Tax=Talaromyces rugulosus TaxID=121627 RepID=A0A7H8QZP1_TALRU|nr:uncharacterized protein TRUGW13939_06686 [Talaromyces rugulosus]QKX59552.1 hypothetical protein TRUGW13939_06686 [Talaromyces rugulosus]
MPTPFGSSVTPADEEIIKRVGEVAQKKGWKMAQVSLIWLRSKGAIPITGVNSVGRVEEAVTLRDKVLTEDDLAYLEEPYMPKPVVGHF